MRLWPPESPRFRAFIVALVAVSATLLVFAASAFAGAFTPESGGSPNADKIDGLYKIVLYASIVVFVGVEGTLLYSVLRFRARKGRVAAQIRGNTTLEIGWTVGAALILVVLTAVTFAYLGDIRNPARSGPHGLPSANGVTYAAVDQASPPGGRQLKIKVNGQQFVWRYAYPNKAFAYETMVVPVDTTVTLDIESQDVDHSWWIPKLGPKFDAVPGYVNHSWFKVPASQIPKGKTSVTFRGQCTELCGYGHANMVARVRAVPVDRYEQWLASQKQNIDQANKGAAAERPKFQPIPSP
ncbi:MAG: cytochrome c oxidase subunit II [Actinomycetota bacterium]|nr:cytochrome c oxidase subunit II [Actinomycetota bacterium]